MTEPAADSAPTLVVTDNPALARYEIRLDDALVGFSEYELGPGMITFIHTEVDPTRTGLGIGGRLASGVLADARARGLRVIARCPFIAAYLRRHRGEYDDLLRRPTAT